MSRSSEPLGESQAVRDTPEAGGPPDPRGQQRFLPSGERPCAVMSEGLHFSPDPRCWPVQTRCGHVCAHKFPRSPILRSRRKGEMRFILVYFSTYSTRYSRAVSHPSPDQARPRLASETDRIGIAQGGVAGE